MKKHSLPVSIVLIFFSFCGTAQRPTGTLQFPIRQVHYTRPRQNDTRIKIHHQKAWLWMYRHKWIKRKMKDHDQ